MADDKLIFDILSGQNTLSKTLKDVQTQTASVEKTIAQFSPALSKAASAVTGLASSFKFLGVTAAGAAAAFIGGSIIKAAEEQEDAINRLNAALQVNGTFTEEASRSLIEYADSIEKTTRFSDEAVLSNLALLQSLAPLTKDGLVAANEAAINLSTALRIDLDSAVRLVGKAANGNTEAFKRYGVEIKKGKDDAETFSNALTTLNSKFGGAAARDVNTFSGAVAQTQNAFSNVLESLGNIVIQNPIVIEGIKGLAVAFNSVAATIASIAPTVSSLLSLFLTFGPTAARLGAEIFVAVKAFQFLSAATVAYRTQLDIIQARQGAGVFSAIITQIKLATASMTGLRIATTATKIAIASLKAVGTFGLSLVLDFAIQQLLQMSENVNIFKEGIALAGRAGLGVLSILDGMVQSIAEFSTAAANIPGAPDFLVGISEGLNAFAKNSKSRVDDLRKSVDALNKDAREAASRAVAGAGSGGGPLLDVSKVAAESAAKAREQLKKQVDELVKGLKNAGETQAQIIAKEAGERARLIQKAEKAGAITRAQAEEALGKIRLDVIDKATKAEKEATEQRRKKLQESIQIAAQNPLNLAFQDVNIELPEGIQTAFSGAFGAVANISKGAQGAAGLLSGFAGAAANAFAPGTGGAAQEVFNLLAQGPEKVKETFDAFFTQLPAVIENVIAAIPQIFVSLAENIGPLIDKIIEVIPAAVQAFVDRLPEIAVKLIEGAIRASIAFATQMPFVAAKMAISLTAEMPKIAISFVDQLVKDAPRFVTELIKSLGDTLTGGLFSGGGGGDILGSVASVATFGLSDVFGFASGGLVPGGQPFTDRVPALLTPGEAVIDRSLVNRLEAFLGGSNQQAGPSGPMTINLVVGEQQLANVILDLNRRGYRLA